MKCVDIAEVKETVKEVEKRKEEVVSSIIYLILSTSSLGIMLKRITSVAAFEWYVVDLIEGLFFLLVMFVVIQIYKLNKVRKAYKLTLSLYYALIQFHEEIIKLSIMEEYKDG